MPFALIILGLALVVSSIRGTHVKLGELLREDFSGKDNFLVWGIVIGGLGLIGYHQKAQTFSRAFMSLVLLAMILSNGGVFRKFVEALSSVEGSEASGSGAAGNTLNTSKTPTRVPVGGAPTDGIGERINAGVNAAGAALDIVKNPMGTVRSVLKSVPIIGKLF